MKATCEKPPLVRRGTPQALNVLNVEAENNPQFQATQVWNCITRVFCKDVPRKRHRKNLWLYDDTFTGKEAVDFLLGALPPLLDENRDVTRPKCVMLLDKFLEHDIIRPVRAEEMTFKDSTELYRLSPAAEEIERSTKQRFVRRASSFSDKKTNKGRFTPNNQKTPPVATPKIAPLPPMVIPTSPKLNVDRRLSMSHGNLSTLHVSTHNSSSLKVPKDLSFITENISFNTPPQPECQPSTSRGSLPPVIRTEIDLFQLWRFCLLDHLDKLLGSSSVAEALAGHFEGADVKWNAEHVGSKGIVKARNENEDFPAYLMKMIRYVARYPFDQAPAIARVSYKGIEVDTFDNICHKLAEYGQMLPNHTAQVLLHVVSIFLKRIPQIQVEPEGEDDTRNQENSTPVRGSSFVRGRSNRSSFNMLSERNSTTPLSSRFRTSMNLPGFRPSAELLKQMEDYSQVEQPPRIPGSSTFARSPYKAPEIMDSALIRGIRPCDVNDLITSMSLVLLTLPPTTRRRLHFVVRFMHRVSANNCLRLQGTKENRYVVLERLASCIIRPSTPNSVPLAQAVLLVTFLMDYESKVFSVPAFLYKSVLDLAAPKPNTPSCSSEVSENSVPSVSPGKRFCAVIDKTTYDSQKRDNSYVRTLLDQICDDQRISEEQRKKRLRSFKVTYPEVYKERFPESGSSSEREPNERRTPLPRFLAKLMKFRE